MTSSHYIPESTTLPRRATLPAWIFPLLTIPTLIGCGGTSEGPALTRVTGIVKLDGEPLPNASVTFQPLEHGRPSLGVTDANGRYSLLYTLDKSGAVAGRHQVSISTWVEGYDDGTWHPSKPERVPSAYNDEAEKTPTMQKDVQGAKASFDFDLSSKVGKLPKRPEPKLAKLR